MSVGISLNDILFKAECDPRRISIKECFWDPSNNQQIHTSHYDIVCIPWQWPSFWIVNQIKGLLMRNMFTESIIIVGVLIVSINEAAFLTIS